MDERKIKDAYNDFELPNFPSAQDLIEKYNSSLTNKTKTNSYKWMIAYTLTMLIMIISVVFIRESIKGKGKVAALELVSYEEEIEESAENVVETAQSTEATIENPEVAEESTTVEEEK